MARTLVEWGWTPDVVLSSDSRRTKETWAAMTDTLPDRSPRFTYRLYHAGMGELRQELSQLPSDAQCVLALGHNPGWENAVSWLTNEPCQMTTANCALLTGSGDTWAEALAARGAWELHALLRPKEL